MQMLCSIFFMFWYYLNFSKHCNEIVSLYYDLQGKKE